MEYFIYIALFVGGWILAKLDRNLKVIQVKESDLKTMVTKSFDIGCQYGCQQTMLHYGIDPNQPQEQNTQTDSDKTVGFNLTNLTQKEKK